MSLKSWKREFYPKKAIKVKKKDAVLHSLKKWIGLREKNLVKHGVSIVPLGAIGDIDRNLLDVDSESCSLCMVYFNNLNRVCKCMDCPLRKHLGKPCDRGCDAPWQWWIANKDPEPMIDALKECLFKQIEG